MKIDKALFIELESYLTEMPIKKHFMDILKDYKESGGDRFQAYATISSLIEKYEHDEEIYDVALDVADIIWGYCSPHHDIWEGSLNGLWPPTNEGL